MGTGATGASGGAEHGYLVLGTPVSVPGTARRAPKTGVMVHREGLNLPVVDARDSAASSAATRKLPCRKAHVGKLEVSHA